jgi:aspartyl-tRNA(Asn)/glutamyl-tRNA(Gln) amidotransferase subunit B
MAKEYVTVIGLEVHAQLLTKSKAFSGDSTEYGNPPNTNVSPITLGHPGTLPVSNKKVVEYAIKMGLACQCEISRYNYYDRKNYFYPDLPKGYQITQDKTPICIGGRVRIRLKDRVRYVALNRIHMEEDAGKSLHLDGSDESLIDLNRAGVPLIEIVSEPDMHSAEEASAFLIEVRKLLRYLEICDGNMEEGSFRCDANVSIMEKGASEYGKKVEVKNMNSFRNVQRAIDHEVERQIGILESGGEVVSETRMFDATNGKTYSLRTKETLNDYRYFPEPDLQPIIVTEEWLEEIEASMPPLPNELFDKFVHEYKLPEYDAAVLTDSKELALYFEELCQHTPLFKAASNWVMGPVKSLLNEHAINIRDFTLSPARLADIIALIDSGKVSHTTAVASIFPAMISTDKSALEVATQLNLIQDSNEDSLQPVIDAVLAAFPNQVKEYRSGKKGLLGMFMGEVRKATQGKADPKVTSSLLEKALKVKQ